MKKQLCITVILLATLATTTAQSTIKKITFRSIEQLSLINGNDAVSGGLQTVNGVTVKNWFVGLGAALDFYRYRSVPLFVDLRREFDIRKGKLFVYGDVGYTVPWVKNMDVSNSFTPTYLYKEINSYKGGEYIDAGLGYAIYTKTGNALLLSAGYSYKKFDRTLTRITEIGIGTQEENTITDVIRYAYHFNRLMIKIGWQF